MVKRNFWEIKEVKCMLEIFKEINLVNLLEQKVLPVHDIYKSVEKEMTRRGWNRKNARQIQNKWSQLKSTYLCAMRNHNPDFYMMKDLEFREDVAQLLTLNPDADQRVNSVILLAKNLEEINDEKKPEIPITKGKPKFKQGSYQKTFKKFAQQIRICENEIQREFLNKQKRLMEYEHALQVEREENIISILNANTFHILASIDEHLTKYYVKYR